MAVRSVLVVEDSPGDASLIRACVAEDEPSLVVVQAWNLEEALATLASQSFDCVLLDLGLPDGFGLEVFDAITGAADTPVVILTGLDDQSVALDAIHRGAHDYLSKNDLAAGILGRAMRYAVERHAIRKELSEDRRRLGDAQRIAGLGSFEYDLKSGTGFWSTELYRLLGLDRSIAPTFAAYLSTVAPDDVETVSDAYGALQSGSADAITGLVHRYWLPTGEPGWLRLIASIETDGAGRPAKIIGAALDVTALEISMRREQLAQEGLRLAFDQAAIGIALTDLHGKVLHLNPALRRLLARSDDEIKGVPLCELMGDPGERWRLARHPSQIAGANSFVERLALSQPTGGERWVAITSTLVQHDGRPSYWFEQIQDVTDRRLADLALESLALHDPLTGLPNRVLLTDRVTQAVERAEISGVGVALVYLDVDRFKVINESLGHTVGDSVLVAVARDLEAVAPGATVARFSGDSFVVLIEGIGHVDEANAWGRKLVSAGSGVRAIADADVYLSLTAGVAVSGPGRSVEDLIRNADVAMHRAKLAGGGHVVAFEEADLAAVRRGFELESDLRAALGRGELQVYYQPIMQISNAKVVGAEALVRWQHPTRGLLSADDFVPLAEAVGLIGELTIEVLHQACLQVARWQVDDTVAGDFRLTVNLSATDLVDPKIVGVVRATLKATGLDPTCLTLEVTETGLVSDTDAALTCLRSIRQLGVRLAIDDFGTGYSSLSYLKRFPMDAVKIDRSFVLGLGRDADDTALVRGILSMTQALGLYVIAEGIENDVQLEALRQLGCPLAQGFFWSPPVAADRFPTVMAELASASSRAPSTTDTYTEKKPNLSRQLGWAVVDALPSAVAVLDADGTILATNLPWQRFALDNSGDAAGCGVGVNYLAVCEGARGPGAEDAAVVARGLRAVLDGELERFAFEYECGYGDRLGQYLMIATPLIVGSGAAVVAHLDITDRYAAQMALAESEERFRSIFDQAPLGIFRMDDAGSVVDANAALCDIVGRSSEDLHGHPAIELFYPEDRDQIRYEMGQLFSGELHQLSTQRRFSCSDGSIRVGQVHDVVIRDKSGHLRAVLSIVEDETERQRLAAELRRAQDLEALGRLAAGIAHEINTPTQFISDNLSFLAEIWDGLTGFLNSHRSAIESLRAGAPPDEIAAVLERAAADADLDFILDEVPGALSQSRDGVERVATIVRAMKAFGHPDHSDPEPSDLNRIITNTVTVARNETKYVAAVETHLGELPVVHCFPGGIGQVILNLLVNAAHAVAEATSSTGDRGLITIRSWAVGSDAYVSIADTGAGIPDAALPHIFEPFYTTKPVGRGTGQGLALAWSTIVDRHGGAFEVTTSPRGTCFTIRIPTGRPGSDRPMAVVGAGADD